MDAENHEITIWGGGTTRTFRPIFAAEELGLRYQHLPIGPRTGETTTDEYTALNRKQKVPFMQDDAVGLSESVAICRYLIEKHGERAGFYRPTTLQSRAKEDEWVCYIYGELDETGLYVMRRHRDLKEIYGDAPAAVTSAKHYVGKHLGVVEHHLRDSAYVMGDEFGLADIMLISCLDWAHFYGLEIPVGLSTYRERIASRPAYQRAFAVNYPQLTGAANGST